MEYGLMPTEADLQALSEFFPTVEIKKIYDVENYHKKLFSILSVEFEKEKEQVDGNIKELKNNIERITAELSKHKVKNSFSKEFLDKYSDLQRQIAALKEQNKAFVEENEIKDSKNDAKNRLEKNIESILAEISFNLNDKMREFNNSFTPKDTGTGTNFKGMILLDLAILYLSSLPALSHDSLLFKNIDDEGINGIIQLYTDTEKLNKQLFIAFDKQNSYSVETYDVLQSNKVLQFYENGGELYGKSWNREVNDETKL